MGDRERSVPVLAPPPPEDAADACLRRAQAALHQRSFDVALGWFDHAAALRPGLALSHVGRAVCLIEMDRETDAGAALVSAQEASASPGEVDLILARLLALGGERDAAFRQLGDAIQSAPEIAETARDDVAFRGMRDHPHFLMVIGDL